MATAEELIVAIKSEGVSETREDLEGVEDSMEETAESAGSAADDLEGFSQRFAGALSAAVAGLAVASAGLLSTVPVISEAFSGLGAVITAIGFQMDKVLRPAITPITNELFTLSNMIFEADGAVGTLIGGFFSLVSVLAAVGAAVGTFITVVAKVGAAIGLWASTGAGVLSILGSIGGALSTIGSIALTVGSVVVSAIVTIVAAIASLPAVVLAALAAIVAFAAAYALNIGGIRDATNEVIGDVISAFVGLASDLSEWAGDLASDAYEWGKGLIERFISGIQSVISKLRNWLGDLQDVGASVGIDVPNLGGFGGGGGGGGGGGRGRPLPRSGSGGATYLDGRRVSENTGRYRADPGRRRGI